MDAPAASAIARNLRLVGQLALGVLAAAVALAIAWGFVLGAMVLFVRMAAGGDPDGAATTLPLLATHL